MGNGNNYYLANAGDGNGWNLVSYDHNTAGDGTCSRSTCDPHFIHWSIVRPTCQSLESNQIVGPLLTNATLLARYLDHVRTFVDEVIGNVSFIEQIQLHGQAIREEVVLDDWSKGGIYFDDNLSLDPTLWYGDEVFPLLPLYTARVADVRQQLEALDRGTYPTLDTTQSVDPEAYCVDWRSMGCPDDCVYDGCDQPDWAVSSYCMSDLSQCYHGDVDYNCNGVPDWEQYDGMENREDGTKTYCYDFVGDGNGPIKISACPAKVDNNNIDNGQEQEAPISPPVQAPTTQEDSQPVVGVVDNDPQPIPTNETLDEDSSLNGTSNDTTGGNNASSTIRDQSVPSAASKRQYEYRPSFQLTAVSVFAFFALSFLVLEY
jgi:hypothetical protein